MLNRIDRYISALFLSYFAGGIAIFVTIFLSVDALSNLMGNQGLDMGKFIQYYLFSLPEIIYRMVPMASVLATVFTLSVINKANELVALYSVGMSLARIAAPILFWVCVISAVIFYASDKILPKFTQQKNYIYYNDIIKKPWRYSVVKNQKIWYRSKDVIFNIKILNEELKKAYGLTLYYFNDKWDLIQIITAERVSIEKGSIWELENGTVTVFTEDSSFPITSTFKGKNISMGEEVQDLTLKADTVDVLSLDELEKFIKKNKDAGFDVLKYQVDYYSKYGFAFAAIVMTLLGIPFSVGRTRSGGLMLNVGTCIGLVFVYWIFYSSALSLGYHGQLNPIIAAWAPDVLMGIFAIFMLNRKT